MPLGNWLKIILKLLIVILVLTLLFSSSWKAYSQFEEWVPYVPQSGYVELGYRKKSGISYVDIKIEFPASGFNISDWGTPFFVGKNVSVNAQIWQWTRISLPVVITESHTYNLELYYREHIFSYSKLGIFQSRTLRLPLTQL